ncbi:MAG: chromate transporter, partial [Pseudomonadota bacterium]
HGQSPIVAALFHGVQPFVIALVALAMGKIAQRALKGPLAWGLAAAAFVALYLLGLPFPVVVAVAALVGLAMPGADDSAAPPDAGPGSSTVYRHIAFTLVSVALLIAAVYIAMRQTMGTEPFDDVATLFTTAALVTFGGAYAVLPFVADQAVESYHWLDAGAMLNGLAIAEATPGPLILVNTYAGYFAGWSTPAPSLSPTMAGVITGALATFYTFAPSFGLILAFAPVVERLHSIPWARRALAGISAAVVGVIANLVAYLADAAFFPAGYADPDWAKIALFAVALVLVFIVRVSTLPLIGLGLISGLGLYLAGIF